MEINYSDTGDGSKRITIDFEAGEDPQGHLFGFVLKERLEVLLRVLATPGDYSWITDADEMVFVLARFGYMANLSRTVLDGLLLCARDQHGIGWGSLATQIEGAKQTTKERIIRTRREYAKHGQIYTPQGLERVSPDEAEARARLAELIGSRADDQN